MKINTENFSVRKIKEEHQNDTSASTSLHPSIPAQKTIGVCKTAPALV